MGDNYDWWMLSIECESISAKIDLALYIFWLCSWKNTCRLEWSSLGSVTAPVLSKWCSRTSSSQKEYPIRWPACPIWIWITSPIFPLYNIIWRHYFTMILIHLSWFIIHHLADMNFVFIVFRYLTSKIKCWTWARIIEMKRIIILLATCRLYFGMGSNPSA